MSAAIRHECPRCGSDEWTWCDYRGCSACWRPDPEDELCDDRSNPFPNEPDAATRWVLRERFSCDGDGCDAEVVCLYDGEEHWQDGATGYRNDQGLFTFCAECSDKPFSRAQEIAANA